MFSKANLVSTLVTAIWGYFGGWLIWGMLVDPILTEHTSAAASGIMREMPDMVHLIIGCLIVGFFLSSIYNKWGSTNYGPSGGFTFGIMIGVLMGFGEGMVNFAVMDMMDLTGTLINAITYAVFYGIMGLLAGLVYSKVS